MSYDNHSLLGFSTVQGGGVVSSTTGTSIQLSSSSGFASGANQNITVWPSGVDPTTSNAEIMRITNNNTQNNTLTVTRAQEGSTALGNIAVGYQVANTITPKVLTDIEGLMVADAPVWQYLGYAQITSGSSTSSSSYVYITGLTVNVTIPTGVTKVKVTAFLSDVYSSTSAGYNAYGIFSGATSGALTTQLARGQMNATNTTGQTPMFIQSISAPSAGSIYYSVGFSTNAGTNNFEAYSSWPAFILVEVC